MCIGLVAKCRLLTPLSLLFHKQIAKISYIRFRYLLYSILHRATTYVQKFMTNTVREVVDRRKNGASSITFQFLNNIIPCHTVLIVYHNVHDIRDECEI